MAVVKLGKTNFKKEIKSDLPVIVDFWASWCGPCQMLGPVFEELSKEFEGKVKFGKVSTEDESNLANEYGIRSIPCMIIFKNGVESDRILGFMNKESLKKEIQKRI
jgi:thioredoxin